MPRHYSRSASKDVERVMHEYKRGTLKSGPGGKGGKVKSREQAIAIVFPKRARKASTSPPNRHRRSRKGANANALLVRHRRAA